MVTISDLGVAKPKATLLPKLVMALSALLLLVNGTGALYGGIMLITDPTGMKIQMPPSILEQSPFDSYLIPGIILLTVNGIFSFVTLAVMAGKREIAPYFLFLQGLLLTGWIVVQMLLLQMFYPPLHLPFIIIGLYLVFSGFYLKTKQEIE